MNPQLNKKVKKYLDSYFRDTKKNSPEHQEAVMLVMRGALTDANFHSEAKELGKYFPKASKKYIGTPMEGVIEDKGIDIAKMAKWDGHDIIDAFAFYLSMSIGGSFGNRLMSLKESLEESLVSEGERLDEKNCPTDASKWSYYKSQAKKKFDVYPSAYANGWASKQYKSAGGGWKACKKESVNELNTKTYRSAVEKGLERGDDKGREIARKAIELMGKSLSKELKDVVLTIKPLKVNDFHSSHFSAKPPMTGQYQIKFTGAGNLHKPDLNLDTKDITLFVKGEVGQAKEYGGWGGPVELDRYIGWKPVTLQLSIRNGSVEVYSYRGGGGLQFTRQGARLIAKIAKEINLSMGGDGNVKHNKIKQFTPHKNESVNEGKYNYKEDAMNAYMKGKITAKELDQIAKKDFKSSVATKKELQSFLDSGYMKSLMADTYGLKVPAMEKKVKELMRFAESVSESPLKEYKHKFGKHNVQFQVSARPNDGSIVLIAKTSNDLDSLQNAIADDSFDKADLAKSLEKKLRIPIEVDYGWKGAGYAFKIDLYSLVKMVK